MEKELPYFTITLVILGYILSLYLANKYRNNIYDKEIK